MKKLFQTFLLLVFFSGTHVFSQTTGFEPPFIEGVWENGGRFIEFLYKERSDFEIDIRFVLKPYYRFVYEEIGTFKASIERLENSKSQAYLSIQYPFVKKTVLLPICAEDGLFFTSFYKKMPYEANDSRMDKKNILHGFWIEQGSPDGILLYPNEAPQSIDAYFFSGDDYIRFRYWLDDLEYNTKKVYVNGNDGLTYEFPRLLKRGNLVYSCVTNTGSVLRNYEIGKLSVFSDLAAENTKGLFISFKPLGAGPGTHASADTYPKAQFSSLENLPLYIMDDGRIFALGSPFLIRSQVKDLDDEIERHNSKRRPPPEPSIPDEDL